MTKLSLLLVVGVLLHIIFLFALFEMYFSTPLVGGMDSFKSPLPARAKRVVFIIADGLRADKCLELQPDGSTPAPFIRSIIETKGAWGVAHAAVPTATRPGHVALTAGFYEDPTSVAKDLSAKAIDFDTVFNESRYTWSWDTPKFLSKVTGGNAGRMFSEKYPGHMKYLAGINAKDMDEWVFKEAQALFAKAKWDKELKERMASDQILFFLHLGGLDHSGYIVRPSAQAYLDHIKFVDDGVRDFVKVVEDHYEHDGQTAYVFNSDHGMTDWGGHGDGSPDETLTPLVVWGPGLRRPEPETAIFPDGLSSAWGLSKWKRTDMDQASMAPLLAAIIGIPYPKNSVLPVPDQLFNLTDQEMSEMVFANMKQLMAHAEAMRLDRQQKSNLAFSPFKQMSPSTIKDMQTSIQSLIHNKQYREAILLTKDGINLARQAIRYYCTYDRTNLWFATVCSYIGWMVYLVTVMYEDHDTLTGSSQAPQLSRRYKGMIITFFTLLTVITFVVLYVQSAVWTDFIFILLPCPIWMAVCLRFDMFSRMTALWPTLQPVLPYLVMTFFGVQGLVLGFYSREVMAAGCLGFAVWPWLFKSEQADKGLLIQWSVSCLGMGFFNAIPAGTRELNYNYEVLGGVLAIVVACFVVRTLASKQLARRKLFLMYGFQIAVLALATFIGHHTGVGALHDKRTPLVSQILSWVILGLGIVEPFLVTTDMRCRLFAIALAWMSPYILTCTSFEAIFLVCMFWNLYVWILLETSLHKESHMEVPTIENGINSEVKNRLLENLDFAVITHQLTNGKIRQSLVRADLRRAFYFLFLSFVSLYGTGLITSVNSFDVAAVFCYLTISNPPIMGTLIVMKIILPSLLIACCLRAIQLITQAPLKSFITIIIVMGEIISLQFFLFVDDEGSWEHVGKVVSHFVIYQGLHIIYFFAFAGAYLLTTCNICCFKR